MLKQHDAAEGFRRRRSQKQFGSPAYLEALEPRQLMSADLYGNTPATAQVVAGTLSSTPVTFADAVSATDTKDFFKIHLGTNQILSASLTGLSANANLLVYSASGQLLATSANAGNADENIKISLNANADYYVLVCHGTGDTNYSLSLSATAAVVDHAGNTRNKAHDLGTVHHGVTVAYNDFVDDLDTSDYYQFTLSDVSTTTLNLSGLQAGGDADIELLNSSGGVIASSKQRGQLTDSIITTLEAGSYYVRVYRYSGGSTYSVTVNAAALVDGAGNSLATAKDVGLIVATPTSYSDSLSSYDTNDYYTFILSDPNKVNITLSGLSGDATLRLLNQAGNVVAISANSGTASENIWTTLNDGIYYIRVSMPTGDTGYTLSVTPSPLTTPPTTSVANGSVDKATYGTFNELDIVGTSGNDVIKISATSTTLNVKINDHLTTYTLLGGSNALDEMAIWGGDGDDTIILDRTVSLNCRVYSENGNDFIANRATGRTTIVSIGGGSDTLIDDSTNAIFWLDSNDVLNARADSTLASRTHNVASFYQPFSSSHISLELDGQLIDSPTPAPLPEGYDPSLLDIDTMANATTLWGDGPVVEDTNQGALGDCYFLATIGSLAYTDPAKLINNVVDLGDGTYAVQFIKDNQPVYIRVDGRVVQYANSTFYNSPQSDGPIWASIMEKAFAYFRKGESTYASIEGGYPNEVLADFNIPKTSIDAAIYDNPDLVYDAIAAALTAKKAIIIDTVPDVYMPASVPLVGNHAYVLLSASRDSLGNITYTVRNPWGFDNASGGATDGSDPNDGIVTITAAQLKSGSSEVIIST